jgi:hypothetical protein
VRGAVVIGAVAGATAALVFVAVLVIAMAALRPHHQLRFNNYAVEHFQNGQVVTVPGK